jgi:hypothetical protein
MFLRHPIATFLLIAGPLTASAQKVSRSIPPDSMWRLAWMVGRDSTEGTFVEPRHVVVSGALVVVLDMGTREVKGFETSTGKAQFTLTARGEGPGEFRRPAKLVATPDGFGVLDHATARLTGYDRSGRYRWDLTIPEIFAVTGACVTPQYRVFVSYARRDSSIVQFDTTGRRLSYIRLPWSVPRPSPVAFAHESRLSAATTSGDCVVAPMFGREWATFTTGVSPRGRVHGYREPGQEPVMKTTSQTLDRSRTKVIIQQTNTTETDPVASGAMTRGDTAVILSYNTKRRSNSLLDYYLASSGRYLYSRNLPMSFTSVAVDSNGTYYATVITEKEQALIAMRPERLPATAPAKGAATPVPSRRAGTPGRPPAPAPAPPPARH